MQSILLLLLSAVTVFASNCNYPSAPQNGFVRYTSGSSYAFYGCNQGYRRDGSILAICDQYGSWSGSKPKCVLTGCGTLSNPANGRVSVVSGKARYSCNYGYSLRGQSQRTCTNGRWYPEEPYCQRGCPNLAAPANGRLIKSGSLRVGYSCNSGYSRRGPYWRTCTNGQWSGYASYCERDCPTLSGVANGRVSVNRGVATYTCNYGYYLLGQPQRVCEHGSWSGYSPACVRKCPSLSNPTNGGVSVNGRTATYTCNSGYTLRGSAVRQCSGGQWSGYASTCIRKSCGQPPAPRNGYVRVSPTGKSAIYICNKGYNQVGSPFRVCSNGQWGGSTPSCCLVLPNPLNGGVSIVGGIATYSCNYGYQLAGKKQRTCQNSFWNGRAPTCVKINEKCPVLSNPSYGSVTIIPSGQIAVYLCNPGYEIRGFSLRTCKSNGQWTGYAPVCIKTQVKECLRLSRPLNGAVQVSGNVARYTCNQGFALQGSATRTCRDGVWGGSAPVCIRLVIPCPTIVGLANGVVDVQGNTVTYTCNSGFILIGNRQRTCRNGVWSGSRPRCDAVVVPCPILVAPTNGNVNVNGDTAEYSCNDGFRLQGNRRRMCPNGIWSGSNPMCVRIPCPQLVNPANGAVQVQGNTAVYTCHQGFELNGNRRRRCNNGVWSGQEPTCDREVCTEGSQWRDSCNQLCTCVGGEARCCRERKDIESMTVQEKRLYVDAVITASTDPQYRTQYETLLGIHRTQFGSGIHAVDQFLPWHRWFLIEYENLLRRVNCNVTVPYWDWSLWASQPFSASLWGAENHHLGGDGGGSQNCVQTGRFRGNVWSIPGGSCLTRQFSNGQFPGPVEVAEVLNRNPSQFSDFEIGLRVNLHNSVHCWIGGTMCSRNSAYAPEFFLHHGYIDKLWADWQERSSAHHDAHFSTMSNPMVAAGSVTPADVIDNDNLPGDISVCYTDPTTTPAADVAVALRALSNVVLKSVSRPTFMPMVDESFSLFGVSASDRQTAEAIDQDMRVGTKDRVDSTDVLSVLDAEIRDRTGINVES
ncbi:CUB and sushi domain-containing protein 2-like [Corticium candelabrum]|uniref:CUB and sushi domain-containing protein 2-like n=1 Tax=Corticium candelabrum TaxID=121492 RepID=UPI002E267396|nr:CUB and sushi domain-containing protein 2-like [Corticium candelabrum]